MRKSSVLLMLSIAYVCSPDVSDSAEPQDQIDYPKVDAVAKTETRTEYSKNVCKATHRVVYDQRGASVRVASTLTNEQCAASSGTYTIHVKYRDELGVNHSKYFPESWQRSDALPLSFQKDYFVAENVDVIRVSVRKLTCLCDTDDSADQEPSTQEPPEPDS